MNHDKIQADEFATEYEDEQAVLAEIAKADVEFDRAIELEEKYRAYLENVAENPEYEVGDYVVWRAGLADGSYIAEKVTKVVGHQYISVEGMIAGLPAEKFRPASVDEITEYKGS